MMINCICWRLPGILHWIRNFYLCWHLLSIYAGGQLSAQLYRLLHFYGTQLPQSCWSVPVIRYILYKVVCGTLSLTPGISREPELPPADLLKFFIHCQFLAPRPWRALLLVSFRLFNYQCIDCTHERVDFGQLKVDSAAGSRLDLFSANDLDIKVRYGHQKKTC